MVEDELRLLANLVAMGELGAVPGVAADALVRAMMGADICVRTESLNRTYERPALRVRSPTSKRLSVAVPRRRAPSLANSNSGARGQRPFSGVHGDPPTHIRVASVLSRTLQMHRDQIPPERPIYLPPSLHQERFAVLAAR